MRENRLFFLDGMRGWGALSVYLFHLAIPFFYKGKYPFLDRYFYGTPLQILSDGELAIYLFFILSGFSLSYKFFKSQGDNNYLREAAQYRYFRLLIPVFFAALIPYFLTNFHLMFNTKAYAGAYPITIHIFDLFKYTFVELPFQQFSDHDNYGLIFWTIYIEFTASIFIFSFLALFGTWNLRFFLYFAIMTFQCSLKSSAGLYFLFFFGVLCCDLFCMQPNENHQFYNYLRSKIRIKEKFKKYTPLAAFFLLVYVYNHCAIRHHHVIFDNSRYLFAILLFIFTLNIPSFYNFFSSRLSKFLGRISFSLYLIHFPILCSFSCFLSNSLERQGYSQLVISLVVGCVSSIVIIWFAYIFLLTVEERILLTAKSALKRIARGTSKEAVLASC